MNADGSGRVEFAKFSKDASDGAIDGTVAWRCK